SPDEALRALTVTPARVLGLERALGTVEAGKIANLVVVEGDLFSQDGRVRQVFVDGRRFEVREQPRAERAEGRAAPGAPDTPERAVIAGEWQGSATTPDGPVSFTLHLQQPQGDQVAGELVGPQGSSPLIGEVAGNQISVKGQVPLAAGMPATPFTLTGTIEGAEMRGTIDLEGVGSFPITAVRSPGGAS
ncbi:MAG TPA: amidohydrolase family protein, partial [Longimicrobiaceae bacterium]|nr:amidohydrolase family protein [Longimicrobiaceae bacterium]